MIVDLGKIERLMSDMDISPEQLVRRTFDIEAAFAYRTTELGRRPDVTPDVWKAAERLQKKPPTISANTIRNLLAGKGKPQQKTLRAIAIALGLTSYHDLLIQPTPLMEPVPTTTDWPYGKWIGDETQKDESVHADFEVALHIPSAKPHEQPADAPAFFRGTYHVRVKKVYRTNNPLIKRGYKIRWTVQGIIHRDRFLWLEYDDEKQENNTTARRFGNLLLQQSPNGTQLGGYVMGYSSENDGISTSRIALTKRK